VASVTHQSVQWPGLRKSSSAGHLQRPYCAGGSHRQFWAGAFSLCQLSGPTRIGVTHKSRALPPQLLLRAVSKQFGYDLHMEVSRSVDSPIIQFTSTPALSSEQILLMITTGQMPQGAFTLTRSNGPKPSLCSLERTCCPRWASATNPRSVLPLAPASKSPNKAARRTMSNTSDRPLVIGWRIRSVWRSQCRFEMARVLQMKAPMVCPAAPAGSSQYCFLFGNARCLGATNQPAKVKTRGAQDLRLWTLRQSRVETNPPHA
jgi:hypothetical protein